MIPRAQRLAKAADFESIFAGGRAYQVKHLAIRVLPGVEQTRFGFVVGKRVSSRATMRNRTKRRLRAAAAELAMAMKKPADIVIIAKSGSTEQSSATLTEELTTVLRQAKLIS